LYISINYSLEKSPILDINIFPHYVLISFNSLFYIKHIIEIYSGIYDANHETLTSPGVHYPGKKLNKLFQLYTIFVIIDGFIY